MLVDAGPSPTGEASTIVDVTGTQGRVLRLGALSLEQLNAVLEPLGATLVGRGAQECASTSSSSWSPRRSPTC